MLAGRSRELAVLTEALEAALGGTAGTVCIEGVLGVGKSALLDAAAGRARALGYSVLTAKASAAESGFAFGVVRQLFEHAVLERGQQERDELLSGPASPARRVIEAPQPAGDEPGGADEAVAFHALHRLAAKLTARAPLLLAVDDVYHADPPSLRWLAYLRRRMHRLPMVLAMTISLGGRATDRALLVEAVAAARRLTVPPLDADGCAELVRAALDPRSVTAELVGACHAATGGNPFLLEELLHVLRTDRADHAERADVADRVGRADRADRAGRAERTGVSGRADVANIANVAGRMGPDGRAAADRVRRCEPPWLADQLLARLRADDPVLAALTRVVAVLGTPDLEAAATATGVPLPVAAEAARSLARMGILRTGPRLELRSPIVRLAVARDVSPVERDGIHARAAELLWSVRAAPERIAVQLLDSTSVEGDWVAGTLCAVARQAIADGAHELAAACLRRALREPLSDESRNEVLLDLGTVEVFGRPDAAIEHLGAVRGGGTGAQRMLTVARGYVAGVRGESADRAVELAMGGWQQRAPAAAGATDSATDGATDLRTVSELCCAVLTMIFADRLDAARRCCREARATDGADGPPVVAAADVLTAMIDYRAGDIAVAMAAARASLDGVAPLGAIRWLGAAVALPVLIAAAVDRDELAAARRAFEYADHGAEKPEFRRYPHLLSGRGRLRAAGGDLHGALADQLECGRRLRDDGILNPAVVSWRSHGALLYARLGRHERAAELAAEDLAMARRWGGPRALGIALRTSGTVRQDEQGGALLAEAVSVLQESGAALELGHALTELGASLARSGRYDESAAILRRARDLVGRCGALGLLARIDGVLRAMPADRSAAEHGGLTPHELRIATMAVGGLTNREMAAELRVTSRAVELHLTKLYRKLSIARRSQLATALTQHGYSIRLPEAAPGHTRFDGLDRSSCRVERLRPRSLPSGRMASQNSP